MSSKMSAADKSSSLQGMNTGTTRAAVEDRKPLRYYQDLRTTASMTNNEADSPFETQIQEIETDSDGKLRLMHITQLIGMRAVSFYPYYDGAGYLAMKHFNERSNVVVPNLSQLLEGCNLYMTMETIQDGFNPLVASSKLYSLFSRNVTLAQPRPAALISSFMSPVSRPLAILSGTYGIPQVSGGATSKLLDDKSIAPLFGRTITTNSGTAEASIVHMKSMGITHFAIIYTIDELGVAFQADVTEAASRHGLDYFVASFRRGDDESIQEAVESIRKSQRRYVFAILQQGTMTDVLNTAYDAGLVGDDYVWYLPTKTHINLDPVDREEDFRWANGHHGAVRVGVEASKHASFEEAMVSAVQDDVEFQTFFLESHPETPTVYHEFNWTTVKPRFSTYSYTQYDAVMSLGIAACQSDEHFFTGSDLYRQFKKTAFQGASGNVAFDADTGTRDSKALTYDVHSWQIDEEASTDSEIAFKTIKSATIDFANGEGKVNALTPIIFHSNSTQVPKALPEIELDNNLVPIPVFAVGWVLTALVLIVCLSLLAWLYRYRNRDVVRNSQPAFLILIVVGAILMASSIVFMTFQEPTSQVVLDFACMATPWLFFLGFSTAFSAIFTKLRRLNMVVSESMGMHRVTVKARAVVAEFLAITLVNVVLLTTWSILDPWVWLRVEMKSFDEFGRSVESYGTCGRRKGGEGINKSKIIVIIIVVWNFVAVACANYQAYLTRNMPSNFKESYHHSLSMAMLLEAFLLGVPLLFMVGSQPTAAFLVRALLVVAICLSVLGPMFLPKVYRRRHKNRAKSRGWSRYMASHRTKPVRRLPVLAGRQGDDTEDARSSLSGITSSSLQQYFSKRQLNKRSSGSTLGESGSGLSGLADSGTHGRLGSSAAAMTQLTRQSGERRMELAAVYSTSSVAQLRANIQRKASEGSVASTGASTTKSGSLRSEELATVYSTSSVNQLRANIKKKASEGSIVGNGASMKSLAGTDGATIGEAGVSGSQLKDSHHSRRRSVTFQLPEG